MTPIEEKLLLEAIGAGFDLAAGYFNKQAVQAQSAQMIAEGKTMEQVIQALREMLDKGIEETQAKIDSMK